ncbi:MAG TPA: type I restriction enzyme HsdR N-terminal domain-containing protein [Rhizomicrobium sp.]|jgi:hypothetical protein
MGLRIPAKVQSRIILSVKKLQQSITDAKRRDVNESDTALIIAEALSDVFGYKKHEEITTEFAVKNTFCDLAVKVGSTLRFLIEVKAVNIELKENHVTQAINYGANQGVDWVILTNGARWQAYKLMFTKPIDRVLVLDVDLCALSPKSPAVLEFFGGFSREVFTPSSLTQMFRAKQAMNRYTIAALLCSDPVLTAVRRELKRIVDGLNPGTDEIKDIVEQQIIKRELLDGDEAKAAAKLAKKAKRNSKSYSDGSSAIESSPKADKPVAETAA